METKPVSFREWSLWIVGILAFSGVSVSSLRDWFRLAIPALSWLVGTVSIPWLALALGGCLLAALGFVCGRLTIQKAETADLEDEAPTGKILNAAQVATIRTLRHYDRPIFISELSDIVLKSDQSLSSREVALAIEALYAHGWIEGDRAWNGRGQERRFELGAPGMDYALARGFPHGRKAT
ncbi:hypothetical protein [Luteibacter rhizovicinus]|uniref:hypothetical protein n=1 Tax=Luteibacter rhizovicinus TaxID=242606 RepID=UPI000903C516|nr:hypothetical protein [Luteibacter rhizovicinus]